MLKVYGSLLCPDCVKCREELIGAGVEFEYLDFSENLINLKEFLKIRDTEPAFDEIRREGKIGIPCLIREDGSVMLEWEDLCNQGM